jgi:hypothetical protein
MVFEDLTDNLVYFSILEFRISEKLAKVQSFI